MENEIVILLAFANDKGEGHDNYYLQYLTEEPSQLRQLFKPLEKELPVKVEILENAIKKDIRAAFAADAGKRKYILRTCRPQPTFSIFLQMQR